MIFCHQPEHSTGHVGQHFWALGQDTLSSSFALWPLFPFTLEPTISLPNLSLRRMKVADLWPRPMVPLAEEGKGQSCSITEMLPSHWTLRPNPGHTCSRQNPGCRPLSCPAPSSKDTFNKACQESNCGPRRDSSSTSHLYWESQAIQPSHQRGGTEERQWRHCDHAVSGQVGSI